MRRLYKHPVRFANGVKLVAQLEGWRGSCGVRYEGEEGTNLAMDICLDLKRNVKWDPVNETFANDDEANKLCSRAMREPWRV